MFPRDNLSIFIGCGLWILTHEPAAAQAPKIDITAFGEFGAVSGSSVKAPNTAKGTVLKVNGYKLLRQTDCIVAKLGTRLGVLARHNLDNSYLPVKIDVEHPLIKSPDGQAGTSDLWTMQLAAAPLYTRWQFEKPYELVPGEYTITILHDGLVRARQRFTVILPGQSGCPPTS